MSIVWWFILGVALGAPIGFLVCSILKDVECIGADNEWEEQ